MVVWYAISQIAGKQLLMVAKLGCPKPTYWYGMVWYGTIGTRERTSSLRQETQQFLEHRRALPLIFHNLTVEKGSTTFVL